MIRSGNDAVVLVIWAVDRVEHNGAIFDAAADRAELVHRPRQRHRAGAIGIDHLMLVRTGAPRRLVAANSETILGAPRNAVQRSAIPTTSDLGVGGIGLFERAIFGE